ncbi:MULTISPECIES: glycosyltransferase family 2 protein [Yimella]|uniref:Glycosyltransferase 2-like domain-containing protein n=1 Tax=Yimella lutea TaxID=587872 RepID=A0A542EJZ2_9MICO|nr:MULTISPECIES: glycosyltransferase family 2 protein [Yimella]MCG8654573.1 glycosyltransferase family 2 protein [Yimella sp. NH-Cas1]RYG76753.1 glycosyltransferase family 2 protein [Yimella sp. RIT 621]TQJ15614.1 hypothetical protein FB459_3171 [Yimella lutea]
MDHVVVVLSYFGREDTLRCLDSIVLSEPTIHPLVIDNGSFDGVIDASRLRFGDRISTLQLGTNGGFTGGMNAGLRWALERSARTVTVLNNDTMVLPGALEQLELTAAGGAAVAPEVRYLSKPGRVWFGGGVVDPSTGLARHLGEGELSPTDDGVRESEVLTGCCITATAAVWRRVGLFDERFFLNFEDSDWSVRAARLGVPLLVDTRAVIHHTVSASFAGEFSYLGLYFYARNGLTFVHERTNAGVLGETRFLRRQLLPHLKPRPGRGTRAVVRNGLVLGYALRDAVTGRFGAAPARLQRAAKHWAEQDPQSYAAGGSAESDLRAVGSDCEGD